MIQGDASGHGVHGGAHGSPIGGDGGGDGQAALTATYIGYGDGSGELTGDANLTWASGTATMSIGSDALDGLLRVRRDAGDFSRFSILSTTLQSGGVQWYHEGVAAELAAIRLHWTAVTEGSVAPVSMEFSGAGSGSYYFDAPVQAGSGFVTAPGLSFSAQSDAGFYRIGSNNIGFAIAGTKRIDFTSSTTTIENALTVTGIFTANNTTAAYFGGPIRGAAGTVSAPAYSFSGDTNTGFYSSAADVLHCCTGGVDAFTINGSQQVSFASNVYLADGTAAAPALTFSSDGNSGLRRVGVDHIALVTGGTDSLIVNASNQVGVLGGNASVPGLILGGDINTGLYLAASDDVGVTAGGTVRQRWNSTGIGFFSTAPVAAQTSGANLTNNVTSGGTNDTITDWTNLTTYATDAAAIRNAVYQLARKLKQVNDGLRAYGLFT